MFLGRLTPLRAASRLVVGARSPVSRLAPRAFLSSDGDAACPSTIAIPQSYGQYTNDVLLLLAHSGDDNAASERMLRDIMAVDGLTRDAAEPKLAEMAAAASSGLAFSRLPYRIGIAAALIAGFGSIPMCFDLHTTLWFNEGYVTTDVPEAKDLETWLEVGSWSWNWMEPPLGQASFFLLCLQYSREQMKNIGMKPYTEWLKSRRASKLCEKYPNYNTIVVSDFSKAVMMN